MSKLFVRALIALFLVTNVASARADYLEVRNSARIRQAPTTASHILAHAATGTRLTVLDNGSQTNGFFHVDVPNTTQQGWVYHTRVTLRTEPPTPPAPPTPPSPLPAPAAQMTVHYINLEQGNAALLEFSCGAMLIDAGGQDQTTTDTLITYLKAFFARRTDLNNTFAGIIITHTHIDHNRALESVVENFTVQNYVYNGHLASNLSGSPGANWMVNHANDNGRQVAIETVSETDVEGASGSLSDSHIDPLHCADVTPDIRIVAGPYASNPGWTSADYKNENNSSLVIRVQFGQSSFLFPGDQEEAAIAAMLQRFSGSTALHTDVYEVGHHGSANGTTADQLTAVAPKIAVISMGDTTDHGQWTAWQYGHPRKSTIDLLENAIPTPRNPVKQGALEATGQFTFVPVDIDKAIYATGWDGTIAITADDLGNYSVKTEH